MPACFTLTPKGATQPAKLLDVDVAMCEHFGAPVDQNHWFRNWYDLEGFALSLGITREKYAGIVEEDRLPIWDWIVANYTVDCWYSR